MKFLFGLLAFAVGLFISIESLANSPEAAPISAPGGSPDSHLTSPVQQNGHGQQNGGHERDNTSLFPPKKPNKSLSTQPPPAELLEPATMSKVGGSSVTLKWQPVAGAESYHLQVATDPNFKWLKAEENLYKKTSYELTNLEPGKHYYWRVASVNSGNNPGMTKSDFVKSMFETASN